MQLEIFTTNGMSAKRLAIHRLSTNFQQVSAAQRCVAEREWAIFHLVRYRSIPHHFYHMTQQNDVHSALILNHSALWSMCSLLAARALSQFWFRP